MKRATTIFVCILIMLTTVVSVSAASDPDIHKLQSIGQPHTYVGAAAATAPVSDGIINKGEYSDSVIELVPGTEWCVISDSASSNYTNVEWFKYYLTYDAERIYVAAQLKDTAFVSNADGTKSDCLMVNIGFDQRPEAPCQFNRYRFDIYETKVDMTEFRRKADAIDTWEYTSKQFNVDEYVTSYFMGYDQSTQVVTVELSFKYAAILQSYGVTSLSEAAAFFYPVYSTYGPSAAGATDSVFQGYIWYYSAEAAKTQAVIENKMWYLYSSSIKWIAPVVHFSEKPLEVDTTASADTTTAAPKVTTAAPVTDAPKVTTASLDTTTSVPTTVATTTAAIPEKSSCGSSVTLSVAVVAILSCAGTVVALKKKED